MYLQHIYSIQFFNPDLSFFFFLLYIELMISYKVRSASTLRCYGSMINRYGVEPRCRRVFLFILFSSLVQGKSMRAHTLRGARLNREWQADTPVDGMARARYVRRSAAKIKITHRFHSIIFPNRISFFLALSARATPYRLSGHDTGRKCKFSCAYRVRVHTYRASL